MSFIDHQLIDKDALRKVALDENTAQADFETYLEKIPKITREINVTISLHGHLNLDVLTRLKFNKVRHILLHDGQITSISNIPENIEIIHCENNLLEELKKLPSTMKHLHVSHNIINKIDLSTCKELEKLYISYNKLQELIGLPKSLLILKCDHNELRNIQLDNATRLQTFYCEENPQLILENIPETIIDGNYPQILEQNLKKQSEIVSDDFKKALLVYFRIKSEYENKLHQIQTVQNTKKTKKTKKTNVLPKCYGCQKDVGMVFSNKDKKYSARCGGTPPCKWNMILNRGQFVPREDVYTAYTNDVGEMKEKIIQQKMAALFRHMGEKEAKELFEKQITAYESANKYLEELTTENDELFYSSSKKEAMEQRELTINKELDNVKEMLRQNNIEDAVKIQHNKIMPLSQAIQRSQYEIMYVEAEERRPDDVYYTLVQNELQPSKLEINLGDLTSVGQV
jgi:hypothetical protein